MVVIGGNETVNIVSINSQGVGSLKDSLIGAINKILNGILGEGNGIYLVVIGCIIWAYLFKRKFELKWYWMIFYFFVFFGFLRWIGIGG